MKKEFTDILIIGAGPSGMVAAGYLQKKETSIKVIEKQKFPRYSIGESLIPRCMDNFEEAGLLKNIEKQGFQKKYGARFIKKDKITEFDFSEKFDEGWNWTWQVPRADFDKTLSDAIEDRGVSIYFETEVVSALRKSGFWEVLIQDKTGKQSHIQAKFIIDSSGYGRVLAKQLNLEAPPQISGNSSLFTQIKESNRPVGKEGELITFEILDTQTWFWYIPFSNGNSSLGFVGPNQIFKKSSANPTENFKRLLRKTNFYRNRFEDPEFIFEPILFENISRNVTKIYGEGFALTGNSAEFLDPVFSSGIAFASESGLLAAKLAHREIQGEVVNWQKEYEEYIKRGVNVFATYVKEWYSGKLQRILFHEKPNKIIKEQICAVLAGYVWNTKNPFVRNHEKMLDHVIDIIEKENLYTH